MLSLSPMKKSFLGENQQPSPEALCYELLIVLDACRGRTEKDSRKNNRGYSVLVKHENEKKAAMSQLYGT